jgi:hypothetical protein
MQTIMATQTKNLPIIYTRGAVMLPDNGQWQNRFEVRSESSNRVYTIAQHKDKKHWGCSCPGWLSRRKCKHLTAVGVPNHEVPFEAQLRG